MPRYLAHAAGLASRRIGGEEVVVSPRAGRVWSLNAAGTRLWELADGSLDESELAADLSLCRGLSPEGAADELAGFAEVMVNLGLMEWRDVPGVRGARSRRTAAAPEAGLSEPPGVLHEEQLRVLAGACDSNHSGQGAACMLFGTCISGFS